MSQPASLSGGASVRKGGRRKCFLRALVPLVLPAVLGFTPFASALAEVASDQSYREAFEKRYPRVDPAPALAEYASAKRYDELYLGEEFDQALGAMSNKGGGMAWGWSYRMASLNEMARATGDAKYLAANLRAIRAALAVRDDATGTKLFDGRIAPAWSSDGYRKGHQALFMVHTGMIVHPMLDAVHLARQMRGVPDDVRRGLDEAVAPLLLSLACHDDAWRDGPAEGEGHYVMLREEQGSEGKPQPGNRLSAMGRALYAAYRVTGDEKHLARSRALARYIQRRMHVTDGGAYIWGYWLPIGPVAADASFSGTPEDTSHAALTMSFPAMLAQDGEVFTADDMKRFGKAVVQGVGRLGGGVLLGDVGGTPAFPPDRLGVASLWLQLAPHAPDVREVIVPFYLRHIAKPRHIDIAYLMRFGQAK